jgi:hypothetical protein
MFVNNFRIVWNKKAISHEKRRHWHPLAPYATAQRPEAEWEDRCAGKCRCCFSKTRNTGTVRQCGVTGFTEWEE